MSLPLTKFESIALTIIITLLTLFPLCLLSLIRRVCYIVNCRFFAASGFPLAQPISGLFHFHRTVFSSQLKTKVGHILVKTTSLRIKLNIDGTPIDSKSHTYPSHSQTSSLLTSSLSLGVRVPHSTQCMRDV